MDLPRYEGPWDDDDPDANFKAQVAEYTREDPWPTIEQLSRNTGVPAGALVRYVLMRWASEGSEALLALGPRLVDRLWQVVATAEEAGTDTAKVEAFDTLRQMISWLRVPLEEWDEVSPAAGESPSP